MYAAYVEGFINLKLDVPDVYVLKKTYLIATLRRISWSPPTPVRAPKLDMLASPSWVEVVPADPLHRALPPLSARVPATALTCFPISANFFLRRS